MVEKSLWSVTVIQTLGTHTQNRTTRITARTIQGAIKKGLKKYVSIMGYIDGHLGISAVRIDNPK